MQLSKYKEFTSKLEANRREVMSRGAYFNVLVKVKSKWLPSDISIIREIARIGESSD